MIKEENPECSAIITRRERAGGSIYSAPLPMPLPCVVEHFISTHSPTYVYLSLPIYPYIQILNKTQKSIGIRLGADSYELDT